MRESSKDKQTDSLLKQQQTNFINNGSNNTDRSDDTKNQLHILPGSSEYLEYKMDLLGVSEELQDNVRMGKKDLELEVVDVLKPQKIENETIRLQLLKHEQNIKSKGDTRPNSFRKLIVRENMGLGVECDKPKYVGKDGKVHVNKNTEKDVEDFYPKPKWLRD